MSIFMSQGLWEMLPRANKGPEFALFYPRGVEYECQRAVFGWKDPIPSFSVPCGLPFEVKENSVLSSAS